MLIHTGVHLLLFILINNPSFWLNFLSTQLNFHIILQNYFLSGLNFLFLIFFLLINYKKSHQSSLRNNIIAYSFQNIQYITFLIIKRIYFCTAWGYFQLGNQEGKIKKKDLRMILNLMKLVLGNPAIIFFCIVHFLVLNKRICVDEEVAGGLPLCQFFYGIFLPEHAC